MADFILDTATASSPIAARIAWITDMHCEKTGTTTGTEFVAVRTRLIASMRKKAFDYILDTGDTLDGSIVSGTLAEQAAQYGVLRSAFTQPFINTLGNHEYLFSDSITDIKAAIGMTDSYYSYPITGTDFVIIVLNSMENIGDETGPYNLGTMQRSWLTTQIAGLAGKHVIIATHIPIMSFTSHMWRVYANNINPVNSGTSNLVTDLMDDVLYFLQLIDANPCIKAFVNGHIHMPGSMKDETNGVQYFDGGSVAAKYYDGTNHWYGKVRGWNYLTLFADGRISNQFIRI